MSETLFGKIISVLNDSAGLSDPRMKWFLMKSPLEPITILGTYLLLIYIVGPLFMRNRKAFNLKPILIVYNVAQIIINTTLFMQVLGIRRILNLKCAAPQTSYSESSSTVLRLHYYYVMLKHFDLLETLFFVLRKKTGQVSILHVHHHVATLACSWISGKYFPGGPSNFVVLYNSFIHSIMYGYYLISVCKPTSGIIRYKKYVTLLQLIQHFLILLSVLPSNLNPNCNYPKAWITFFNANLVIVIYFFCKFYKNVYMSKDKIVSKKHVS